ncbi:MAG: ankyrin repeat domain-containing protein [Bryobacterales bacterium]|nr:ankyrin repeat domain-containing protein [Bryobacterales bacterium]
MLPRLFWTLLVVEALALVVLLVAASSDARRSPEGPVGAWILLIPPVVLAAAAMVFHFSSSAMVRWACLALLAYPLVLLAAGPLVRVHQDRRVQRSLAGDDDFPRGPFRELAHAIRAEDAATVRRVLPAAGDLNRHFGGDTILRFAVANTKNTEIVRLLLDAGAVPNFATAYGDVPLVMALHAGPAMVELLLGAGADPNVTDGAGRPLWWSVLSDGTDGGLETLALLGRRGINLELRDGESGPVGWAAYHRNWRAVQWLVEQGAAWQGEQRYGTTVEAMREQFRETP